MSEDTQVSAITIEAKRSPLRRPRGRVFIDGKEQPGLLDLAVTRNNYFNADTFDAGFSIFVDPAYGPDWWLSKTAAEIVIEMGNQQDDGFTVWRQLLKGIVDNVQCDFARGFVAIQGRDLTARFIDNRVSQTFKNLTSSEVVKKLAAGRGLTADVASTSRSSGTFYQKDHTSTHADTYKNSTEWDLIVHLARCEGFDAWVDGETLHFKPVADHDDPYVVRWSPPSVTANHSIANQSNVERLCVNHNLALAKDIHVVVKSWHSGLGKGFKGEAGKPKPKGKNAGEVQEHVFVVPNLTEAECKDRAAKLLDEMTKHEYMLEFDAPATTQLDPRRGVRIEGVTGVMDQNYFVDEVSLRLSHGNGFTMSVRAKNHPEPSGDE